MTLYRKTMWRLLVATVLSLSFLSAHSQGKSGKPA